MRKITGRDLLVPLLLLAFSAMPMMGGVVRLLSLSAPATAESARFVAAPAPILIHILAFTIFSLVGAFQFSTAIRVRWPSWHRGAGKVIAASGIVVGLTGMWMAQFYEIPVELQGPLLHVARLVVGTAMVGSIVLAWRTILRRQVAQHEAWMIRAYALGQGAGTQVLLLGPWMLITGEGVGPTRDVLMTLTWIINAVVAEWIIRRRAGARLGARTARAVAAA